MRFRVGLNVPYLFLCVLAHVFKKKNCITLLWNRERHKKTFDIFKCFISSILITKLIPFKAHRTESKTICANSLLRCRCRNRQLCLNNARAVTFGHRKYFTSNR